MKMLKSFFIPLLCLFMITYSCQSDPAVKETALHYIPDDVNSLLIIDVPDLLQKADFDQVKQMEFYKKILEEVALEQPALTKMLEDPGQSGLAIDQPFYIAMKIKKPAGQPEFGAIVAPVADKEKLEKNFVELNIQFVPASQNFGHSSVENAHMVWNDEVIIMGVGGAEGGIKAKVESYLNTTPDNALSRNKNLQKCLKEEFDIAHWQRIDPMLEGINNELFNAFSGLSQDDLTDNFLHSFLRFENGRMEGETYFHIKRRVTNDLQLFFKDKVKTDFSKYMPADNLGMMMAAAIDLKGINQILIEKHVKGAGMQQLDKIGLSFEDVVRAFTGEVAVGMYSSGENELSPMVVLPVEDDKHFQAMIHFAMDKKLIVQKGENRYQIQEPSNNDQMIKRPGAQLLHKNGMLYLSEQTDILDRVASGQFSKGGNTMDHMAKLMGKNVFSAFGDIAWLAQFNDDFKELPFTDAEATANRKKAHFILRMANQNTNSLKQFFQELNEVYQKRNDGREDSKI